MNILKLFKLHVGYVLSAYLICVDLPASPELPQTLNKEACFAFEYQS